MSLVYVILFAILIAAVPALLIWKLYLPIQSAKEKGIFITIAALLFLILETGFIMTAMIPGKINQLIDQGIVNVESYVIKIDSTFMDKTLDANQLKDLISDTKQLKFELEENSDVNWLIEMVGVNVFLDAIEEFANNVDTYLCRFNEDQVDFTFRNVLNYVKLDAQPAIYFVTKIIEIVVLIIAFVAYLALTIISIGRKKGWYGDWGTPQVQFGEDFEKEGKELTE